MPKVAVVQAAPVAFHLEATLAKTESLLAEAAASGAKLVLFPEAFIGCYPKGHDFGARVGGRTPEGRVWFRSYFESAIDVPGPATHRLGEAARKHDLWLLIGVIERDGGTLYCTVLFFSPDGTLAAKHRKLMPTAMERIVWGFGDGSTLPVVDTPLGRVGAVICWENYMPLLRTAMYAKGTQLYCAPTVDDRETWASSMRHIAFEGRCYVLSACQYATRADYPEDYPAEAPVIRGGSIIADPLGRVLAGPVYDQQVILTADIDLNQIAEGKYDLDVVGHYARPDIFRLEVDESARPPVALT